MSAGCGNAPSWEAGREDVYCGHSSIRNTEQQQQSEYISYIYIYICQIRELIGDETTHTWCQTKRKREKQWQTKKKTHTHTHTQELSQTQASNTRPDTSKGTRSNPLNYPNFAYFFPRLILCMEKNYPHPGARNISHAPTTDGGHYRRIEHPQK